MLGKPATYPPEDHTHEQGDIDGLEDRLTQIEGSISSGGGFVDAPNDGKLYGRQSEAWAEVVIPDAGASSWNDLTDKPTEFPPAAHNHDGVYQPVGNYIEDADSDGKQYARKDGAWSEVVIPDGQDSLWQQSDDDIYYDEGNVGIGTDSPAQVGSKATLHIANDANGGAVRIGDAGNMFIDCDTSGGTRVRANGGDMAVGTNAAEPLTMITGGQDRLTIDASGNAAFTGEVSA